MKKFTSLLFGSALLMSAAVFGQTQRTPLYESFTSSTCPPCYPGNIHLEGLFNEDVNEGKYTSLKYQMSWPGSGDPYYTAEGGTRRSFYAITGVPSLQLDGGFDSNPTSLTQGDMDAAYAVPAEVELSAFYRVNEATKTVSIDVDVTALNALESSGGLFLRVAIYEKQTTGNVKTNGETKFEHVMKKMLPSASGTYLGAMDAGETTTVNFEYTFEGDYRLPANAGSPINHASEHSVEEFSDLGVVVWVQRNSTKEVYQSGYAQRGFSSVEKENTAQELLSVYPNPATDNVRISFQPNETANNATISVLDFTGKVVYTKQLGQLSTTLNTLDVNTADFDSGVYFVTLTTENGQRTKKLSIIH